MVPSGLQLGTLGPSRWLTRFASVWPSLPMPAGELRTFTFDSIATTGDVAGDWNVLPISALPQGGNDAGMITVTVYGRSLC